MYQGISSFCYMPYHGDNILQLSRCFYVFVFQQPNLYKFNVILLYISYFWSFECLLCNSLGYGTFHSVISANVALQIAVCFTSLFTNLTRFFLFIISFDWVIYLNIQLVRFILQLFNFCIFLSILSLQIIIAFSISLSFSFKSPIL